MTQLSTLTLATSAADPTHADVEFPPLRTLPAVPPAGMGMVAVRNLKWTTVSCLFPKETSACCAALLRPLQPARRKALGTPERAEAEAGPISMSEPAVQPARFDSSTRAAAATDDLPHAPASASRPRGGGVRRSLLQVRALLGLLGLLSVRLASVSPFAFDPRKESKEQMFTPTRERAGREL